MTYGYMKKNNKKYFYVTKTYKTQLTLITQVHIMLQVHISTHLRKITERNNTVYSAIDTGTIRSKILNKKLMKRYQME